MSERTGLRYGLLGLIVIALLAALAYFVARPPPPRPRRRPMPRRSRKTSCSR